jgi:hypothetical protein
VAPGIRLETVGNDYQGSNRQIDEDEHVGLRSQGDQVHMSIDEADERYNIRASSSMHLSGRSSSSAAERGDRDHDEYRDAEIHSRGNEEHIDTHDEMDGVDHGSPVVVHERVGGSGATAENASKGTSVGHFGPLGEAIPGVPPHLDPRQPHFRPPSPGAASVFSVAVQPPASPKFHSGSGGQGLAATPSSTSLHAGDIVDSGEETESFDNGAMTPTLSDDYAVAEDVDDQQKMDHDQLHGVNSTSGPSFSISRMHVGEDQPTSSSSGAPYQVSFSPVVTSHHRGSISSFSGRAPSIAATAGSSRAPSARGLSPPASLSRAGTTEGSSIEEFESSGTGLGGDAGAETPSVGRSRRSSYSALSSEQDGAARALHDEVNNRTRGGTLVPSSQIVNPNRYAGSMQSDVADEDGPSLAPSEAGSDSTRSMSIGHVHSSGYPTHTASERYVPSALPPPGILHTSHGTDGGDALSEASNVKGGYTGSAPVMPNLLAIKRAVRRDGSGPASTAATAGTVSPPSSISIDGDFEDAGEDQMIA